jgi:phage tail-like protein
MTDWVPTGADDAPAFTVQRPIYSEVTGGDYVRGGAERSALRYGAGEGVPQDIVGQSSLVATVSYTDVSLSWGWPTKYSDWVEVAIVRSGFGRPSTVNDGVTIYRSTRTAFPAVDVNDDPMVVEIKDPPQNTVDEEGRPLALQPGRMYYYTLFFYTTSNEWVPALSTSALVPRNFEHHERMWESIPPYYRWTDERGTSDLQKFLQAFGFELDYTREFVEQWQETYHADMSPMQLLRRVGENLGLSYEQGLGDIRYRALVGKLSELYLRRGTQAGLQDLIEVSSKYQTVLTLGENLLNMPDDAEFRTGSGNWSTGSITDPVLIAPHTPGAGAPTGYGATGMLVQSTAAAGDIYVRYGVGPKEITTGVSVTMSPKFNGVLIREGSVYGFDVWYHPVNGVSGMDSVGIQWYGSDESLLDTDEIQNLGSYSSAWRLLSVQAPPPVGAVYACPFVRCFDRASTEDFELLGAIFYNLGSSEDIVAPPPTGYPDVTFVDRGLGSLTLGGYAKDMP